VHLLVSLKNVTRLINARNMEHDVLFSVGRESRREIMRELDHEAAD
jgi:hypothetical protein